MPDVEVVEMSPEVDALVSKLMMHSANDRANINRQLSDSYQHQAEFLKAKLELIQVRIDNALNGRFKPTDRFLLDMLYPSNKEVEFYIKTNS
jgi:hypothetical protein